MITEIAYSLFGYSLSVCAASTLVLALGLRWHSLRRPACRVLAVFAVFALASGYVWLEVGPETDYRLQIQETPRHLMEPPRERRA